MQFNEPKKGVLVGSTKRGSELKTWIWTVLEAMEVNGLIQAYIHSDERTPRAGLDTAENGRLVKDSEKKWLEVKVTKQKWHLGKQERQHSKTKLAVEVRLLSAVNQSLQGWCLCCITSLEGYLGLLLLSPFSPLENLWTRTLHSLLASPFPGLSTPCIPVTWLGSSGVGTVQSYTNQIASQNLM